MMPSTIRGPGSNRKPAIMIAIRNSMRPSIMFWATWRNFGASGFNPRLRIAQVGRINYWNQANKMALGGQDFLRPGKNMPFEWRSIQNYYIFAHNSCDYFQRFLYFVNWQGHNDQVGFFDCRRQVIADAVHRTQLLGCLGSQWVGIMTNPQHIFSLAFQA